MTEKMMTPLRQRMIDDMTIRNMSPSTKKIYVYAVAKFSRFHGRSPDKLTFEDVREYRLHLVSRDTSRTSINPIMGALRFFYGTTLGRKEAVEQMPYARTAGQIAGRADGRRGGALPEGGVRSQDADASSSRSMPPACGSPKPSR